MISPLVSRRDVLGLSGVALSSLAGCTTRSPDSNPRGSPSPTAGEHKYERTVNSPEFVTVREPEGKPAVRSSAHSPEEDMFESSAKWEYEDWIVTASTGRDALDFTRTTTGVAAARDFIAATDLSKTTLLVHQYDIGTCETRRLRRLEWSSDFSCGDRECVGIFLTYESTERESDCSRSDTDDNDSPPYSGEPHASEATFVRIPAHIRSYGRFTVQV